MSETVEAAVTEMIATSFGGEHASPADPADPADPIEPAEESHFDFDEEFQTKIAALAIRDQLFAKRTEGLLRPEYFENIAEAALVNISLRYFAKYKKTPDQVTFLNLLKEDIKANIVRKDMVEEAKNVFKRIYQADIADRDYVIDQVGEFARYQAVGQEILKAVDSLGKGNFSAIEKGLKAALQVGAKQEEATYDYFARIVERTQDRRDTISGVKKPNGITTGIKAIDDRLMHKGWGRRELSSILGGAKAGKTTGLINFAKAASLAGHNALYATLEVSAPIISTRLDASISGHIMDELAANLNDVDERVKALHERAGKLNIVEYPTGTLRPADLRRLLDMHLAAGTKYDIVVVDYADIMAPDMRSQDGIENSKSIYEGLRAIAQEYDLAMLTATQTNREGFKSSVAKAEHVAEDFNKVRIVDLMISINKTEEEMERNEARLFFAASRNQRGAFTLRIQQNLECMRFVTKVLGIE